MKEKEYPQKLIPQKRQKKNQKPISLMNINAKFQNKTLENKTWKTSKQYYKQNTYQKYQNS